MSGHFEPMQKPHDSVEGKVSTNLIGNDHYIDKTTVSAHTTPLHFEHEHHANQVPETRKERFWRFADKWWLLEAFAWFVSVLALMGIVIVLRVFEGRPSPDTLIKPTHVTIRGRRFHAPGFLTINALLSLLATILKGALLFPVAAALSQLKWTWFQAGRPLSDFQMFDSASQGTFGSVMLLWTFKGRRLASLGAFVILATLILDFATQNLVSYPLNLVIDGPAMVARTSTYNTFPNAADDNNAPQIGRAMLGAINTGIFDLSDNHGVSPICPTGNCTYPEYKSLGVCSQCFDVSPQVIKECSNATASTSNPNAFNPYKKKLCTYSLSNGLDISELGPALAFTMSSSASNSIHFQQLEESGLSTYSAMNATWVYLTANNGDLSYEITDVHATECGLWFCERTYHGEVINGTFTETVLDTNSNGDGASAFDSQAISSEFGELWVGNVSVDNFFSQLLVPSGPLPAYLWLLDFNDTKTMMASVATSMTTQMRNTGTVGQALTHAVGTALKQVPFVAVKWPWITVPASLLILTLVFLVMTARVSAREGLRLWKGSSLAAFYHPLTNDGRQQLGNAQDLKHVEKIAGDLNVRWANTPKGWRFIKDGAAAH